MKEISLRVPDGMVHLLKEWAAFIPSLEVLSVKETALLKQDELNSRMSEALKSLKKKKIIRHLYDYTWIMTGIGDGALEGMSGFKSPQNFIDYLNALGVEHVPCRSTLSAWYGRVLGEYPNWVFTDTEDPKEILRRKNVFAYLLIELDKLKNQER